MDVDDFNAQASSSRSYPHISGQKGDDIALSLDDVDGDVLLAAGNLESDFYTAGYDSGFAHGRLHGLFEGRQLGQEKAWEIWEEVGFYEGFASFWVGMDGKGGKREAGASRKEVKAINHARTLLSLIESFPTYNPTPSAPPAPSLPPSTSISPDFADPTSNQSNSSTTRHSNNEGETDLAALLSSIRARYRLLCASLGTRPRLVASGGGDTQGSAGGNMVEGIEGPMKGVDTRQLRF